MKNIRLWAPLAAFALVAIVVAVGLWSPADRTVRSALVGKPLPALTLPAALPGRAGIATAPTGKPRFINVFASWCIPCAAEAPQLLALKQAGVAIEGVAIRDDPADLRRFLNNYGDPFAAIGDDREGRFQFSIGSSGVPESYVIDGRGRIVLQHIGYVRADEMADILAALRSAA